MTEDHDRDNCQHCQTQADANAQLEHDSLTWVIQAAGHKRLSHEQAAEIARAVLAAGWAFRPDIGPPR